MEKHSMYKKNVSIIISLLLLTSLLSIATIPIASAAEATIQPSADSYMNEGAKDTNYGGQSYIEVSSKPSAWGNARGIIEFDLSSIPSGSTITSVTLSLYLYSTRGTNRTYCLHKVTKNWTESGVTWNKYDGTNNWTTSGGDYEATASATVTAGAVYNTWVDWSSSALASDVSDFVNNPSTNFGWIIKDQTEGSSNQDWVRFYSKEHTDTTLRPKLTVTYTAEADTTPPAAPTGLTATAVGPSQIDLDWNNNTESDLDHYNVYRSTTSGFTPGTGTFVAETTTSAYSDTGLSASTTYYYKVTAVDTSGNESDPSAEASATTLTPDTTPPAAPTGLTATAVSTSQINLDWANNTETDLDHYSVYRSTTSGFTPGTGNFVAETTVSNYSDTGLSASTTYYYKVTAVDTSGNESDPSAQASATTEAPDTTPPAAPTGLTATAVSSSQINLDWANNTETDLDHYSVYRSTTSGFTPGTGNFVANTTVSNYSDTGLSAETTYYYKVTAEDTSGNESDPSAQASATTQAAPVAVWNFECHSYTHPTAITNSEMQQVNDAFAAHGLPAPLHHAYPYGNVNQSVAAAYRLSGRTVGGTMETAYPVPNWYLLKAAEIQAGTAWSTIQGWVDQCISQVGMLHIFSHRVTDPAPQYGMTPAMLNQLLDYLVTKQNAGQLTVMTMRDAYDAWNGTAPIVVISFDDGWLSDYTTTWGIFKAHGLLGTSYIYPQPMDEMWTEFMSWALVEEMAGLRAARPAPGPSVTRAGVRESTYGISPFPSAEEWTNDMNTMASYWTGSLPTGIWIVGIMDVPLGSNMTLQFPEPAGGPYPNISFESTDMHESYLDYFDTHGIDMWLQVEPAFADMNTLIDLVLNQYKHHSCVKGFGVDCEWYKYTAEDDWGIPVTDAEAQAWETKVKSHNANYTLFLKHFNYTWLPPSYRGDIIFVSDSQDFNWAELITPQDKLDALVYEATIHWAPWFYPNPVWFQIGYESDQNWWETLANPPKDIGDAIDAETTQNTGIFWVDFTLRDIFPAPPDTTPPAAPTGLTATAIGPSQIDLDWANNTETDLDHYSVYRSTTSGFTPGTGNFVANTTVSNYSDTGLSTETTYYYKVTAEDTSGNESDPSAQASATTLTPDTTPPAAPTGLTATAVSSSRIDLDWANNTEADLWKYSVYRSTTSGFTPGIGTFVAETTASNYSDTGLSAGTTYYYKVTAEDTSGNESDPSAQASATTEAVPPPVTHAGLRSSTYGAPSPFPSAEEWTNDMNTMASYWSGSQPTAIWIVGIMDVPDVLGSTCRLEFPEPAGGPYTNIVFDTVDRHESYLDYFDTHGIDVWLQVEPGDADMDTLIDLVLNQYGNHSCVKGFGVDVEWYTTTGASVTDSNAQTWESAVKSHSSSYTLFIKYWTLGRMPPTYRGDIIFCSDSQEFESLDTPGTYNMVDEFSNEWAPYFYPNPVWFQYGYPVDQVWWETLTNPPKDIGDAIDAAIPQDCGLFWVDFTMRDVFAPPDTTPPAAPTGLTATAVSSSQINLDWANNTETDLASYNVYRSTTSGFTPGTGNFVANTTVSSYSDTGLSASTTYYYKVTAVDTSGNESDPSAQASATTEAAPPTMTAYYCDVDTMSSALPMTVGGNLNSKTEATSSEYTAIASSDGSRWTTPDPGYGDEVFLWLEMYTEMAVETIGSIELHFEGYLSSESANFSIWARDLVNGEWDQIGTTESIATGADGTITRTITVDIANYIDASGKIIWGVYESADSQPLNIDYVYALFTEAAAPSVTHAGVRESTYGISPFPSAEEWENDMKKMASYWTGSQPTGIWNVGVMWDPNDCHLEFPGTSTDPNILFSDTDFHEPYFDYFDTHGIDVWLQVEPADADVGTLIDLVLNQYGHHSCVKGFGVDVEWYKYSATNDMGVPVTDAEAEAWESAVKSHSANYTLYLKHFYRDWMPPNYRGDIIFNDDYQIFDNLSDMVAEFADNWAPFFYPNPVWFQVGYEADKVWWDNLDNPPKDIGDALDAAIPNDMGIFWVDFTLRDAFPPPPDNTPPAVPSGFIAAAVSMSRIDLDWANNTEVDFDYYSVYRSTTSGFTPGTGNFVANTTVSAYSDTGLSANTTYYYKVTAVDLFGNESSASSEASATTKAEAPPTVGWDFEGHTHTHPYLTQLTEAGIQSQLEQVNSYFQANLGYTPEHMAYPYGDYNDTVKSVVAEYRLTGRAAWDVDSHINTYPMADRYQMNAMEIQNTTAVSEATGWIDEAITNNALLNIFTHRVMESPPQYACTPATLRAVCDYLLAKQNAGQLTVLPMRDAYISWDGTKAVVVLSFDDGYTTDYTTTWPILRDEYGFIGTSYIYTAGVGMTVAQMQEMAAGPADTTPPAAPTGLTATAIGPSQIDLDWANNTEADLDHYSVYRSTTSGFTPGTGNFVANTTVSSYSDTGLSASTTYYYKVTAVDTSNNESDPSAQASATTETPPAGEVHVEALLATDSSQSTGIYQKIFNDGTSAISGISAKYFMDLTEIYAAGYSASNLVFAKDWDQSGAVTVSGPTAYDAPNYIYYYTMDYGTYSLAAGSSTQLRYRIYLSDWSTNWDASNDWSRTGLIINTWVTTTYIPVYKDGSLIYGNEPTADTTPPAAPTGLIATAVSPSQIDLDWANNTEADMAKYKVYRSTTSGFTPSAGNFVAETTVSNYSDTGLSASTTYYYKVTAVDTSGNESSPSAQASATTEAPDATPPAAPTGLTATAASSSQINLDWANNTEADLAKYSVYRSTTSGFTPGTGTFVADTTVSNYSDTGLSASTTYYYKVTAVDTSNNESSPSAQASATTQAAPPVGGWDFECHSYTHPYLTQMTEAQIQSELQQVNDAFAAHGLPAPQHHAYPYGEYNATVESVVAQYRLTGRAAWAVTGAINTYPMADWYAMNAVEIQSSTAVSTITGYIDQAITNDALLNIFTHRVMESPPQYACTPATLRAVCDYLLDKQNAGQLQVLPMRDAYTSWNGTKAVVALGFDDGYTTDYTTTWGILKNEYGFVGTSYLYPNAQDGNFADSLTWAQIQEMAGPAEPPAAPTGLTATAVSSSQIDLDWANNTETDLDHYSVYRSTTSGFTPGAGNFVDNTTENAYSDTGLSASTTYYYKVTAVDTSQNESDPSAEASATTEVALDELRTTYTTTSEDNASFTGKITLENPNNSYVWNGTYFAIRSAEFETTSQITSMKCSDGSSLGYTVEGDVVTLDLSWQSLFPYGTSVEIEIEATKSGSKVYPQQFKTHYVRGENITYPEYQGLPPSWAPQKPDLSAEDLIFNQAEYYNPNLPPIQDKLIMYDPPSDTQIQIGLAPNIDYPVNGATDVRAWIPTKYMAMGLGFVLEELNINPNYLAALGSKEDWAACVTKDPSVTQGIIVVIDGEEWVWPIQIDHPDGPYQVESGNFNDMVSFFPDYFPPSASHDNYTKVSDDMSDPNWISSAIVAGISLTVSREMLNAVPEAEYTEFMANAKDEWAEFVILTFAYNRGMGSLEAKKLFSTNREQALNSTDICENFDMGGFASHVPTVRAITDAMNNETTDIYDAEITWTDIENFLAELRTFFANGVPSDAEWNAMREDMHGAYDVLAQHWGGTHISLRYDFLTLIRVLKKYRPQPYHPRPTGEDWYYRVQNLNP